MAAPTAARPYCASTPGPHPAWHLLLLPENLGNCRAFNLAFWQSRGEFVVDFATDDVLLPRRIAQQVALFERLPADYGMVYSNCELIAEAGQSLGLHHFQDGPGGLLLSPRPASGWVFAEVLRRFFISTPTMLMRRACLEALGGYDEHLSYEDFDFWVRASRSWRFQYQNEVTTRKRKHPRSLSAQVTRHHDPHLASTLAVCAKALALCRTRAERWALAGRPALRAGPRPAPPPVGRGPPGRRATRAGSRPHRRAARPGRGAPRPAQTRWRANNSGVGRAPRWAG